MNRCVAERHEVGQGPAVLLLGADEHTDKPDASRLREREAADVAAAIRQAMHEEWTVRDEVVGSWRPVRLADIAILLPARTSLDFLEDALDAAGIAYKAESSSLVYQAPEIRDLMATARAIADPTDHLATLTALRSPLFGCGDDDLWAWKHAGGSFNLLARAGDAAPAGVARDGLDYLRGLHYRARWMTPSELLATIVADRRMMEVAATTPRARDQWRRLRFVLDQARAWSDTEHGGLRGYLAWAGRQAQDGSRVAEAVLPETDLDAVRIMTIHAAKGLEFPVVHPVRHELTPARTAWREIAVALSGRVLGAPEQVGADQRLRGQPTARRADGRVRAPSPAVCRDHPGQGPFGRVAASSREHGRAAPGCLSRRVR